MKELKEGRKEITVLELNEGSLVGTCDFVFEKIGDPVPLNSNFVSEDPPAQAIAVSDQFGIVFVAHAKGFYLVKIKEVAELAKKVKETGKTLYIKDSSISDVNIGNVYILALSSDSSTLAASIGGIVHFFSVDNLLNKVEQPFSSISLSESEHVQDLQWRKSSENSYVILSNHGVLYHGDLEKPLKDVMDNVDAVDWSVKGDFIAIARKSTLSLLSSQFKEQFLMSLPFQSGDTDSNCSLKVDSIKWVRDDNIILGCIQLIDDGKENGYVVHVITSKECGIVEASSNPLVLSFDFFSSFNESILLSGHGPYLFASYLELWELTLAANRKNIDGHIVMLGWLLDNRKTEATALDIIEDKWMPRIELQDNGDDNLIVGFGVASTSISEKFEVMVHDEVKELSLYRVLLCLTIDGKLSLFRVARISEGLFPLPVDILPPKVIPGLEEDTSALRSKELKVEEIALDAQRSEVITKEHNLDRGVQLRKDTSALRSKEPKVEEMALNAELLPPKVIPALEEDTSALRSKELKVEEIALDVQRSEVITKEHNLDRGVQLRKDTSALRSKEPKVEEMALNAELLPPKVIPAFEKDTSALRSKELKVEEIALDAQRSEVITKEHNLDRGVQLRKDTSALRSKEPKIEEMALNAELLPPKVIPALEGDTSVLRSKEPKVEDIALDAQRSEVITEAHNLYRSVQLRKDTSALRSKEPKVEEIALNAQRSAVSMEAHHLDRGVQLLEKTSALRSKESKIEGIALGAQRSEVITEAHNLDKGVQLQKDTSALRSGRSANHKGEPKPDYQRNRQSSRGSNSEVDFSMDFGNVKEMANELDNLLLSIEEASGLRDAGSVFQKLVLALEEGLKGLSKGCKERKMKMEAQLGEIQNLLDKTMQVSARRIHMESIVKQVSSSQYRDLWNRQRLNPEFELKRRNILKVNQNLTNHLIELERHFNAMEINRFGENGGIPKGRKVFQNSLEPSRQIHCLHSLYNTTSSQLAVAEELSEYLSKQMALLNIATPSLKRHNVAKELFDSIGLVHENYHFQSPDVKDAGHSPDLVNKIPCSTLFSSTKEYSGRKTSDAMKSIEPETARRRRESLDRSWVSFEPQKTTVKRMLQEERSKLSTNKSRFEKSGIIFNSRMIEDMDRPSASSLTSVNKDQHQTNKYSASRDGQSKPLQQNPESSPTSFFKWSKYNSGSSETMGLKSTGMQMQQASYLQSLSHAAASSTVQDKTTKTSGFGLRSTGFGFGQSDPYGTEEVSTSEARSIHQLETRRAPQTSRISGTILPTNSDLPKKAANGKAQPSAFSNFKIDENVQTRTKTGSSGHGVANPVTNSPALLSESAPPFPVYGSAPAFTSPISLPTISSIDSIFGGKINTETNQMVLSLSSSTPSAPSLFPSTKIQVSSSTTSFLNPKPQAASSPTPSSPAENLSSQAPALSPSSVPSAPSQFPSTKIQVSSSTPSPFLNPKPEAPPSPTPSSPAENLTPQTLSSPPKPLLEKLSATSEPALPSTPTNEVSTGPVFVKQSPFLSLPSTLNLFGTTPSSSSLPPNMAPAVQVLPLGPFSTSPVIEGKNEDSEDEMEEEAPDPTTEISFRALGAFGLGSTTEPSAPKPNPFGISFSAAANQASSQFSVTTPNGELFRPASFSLPTGQPSQPSLPTNPGLFSGGFGGGIGAKPPTASGFGQPAQIGAGQQALGSVLGSFGQSRQLGVGLAGAGHASLGGFGSGGFANAASGGVFPGTASGSGFAATTTGGGFAAAATGGGFAAVSSGGGFQSFGNKQEGSAFSAFGGGSATGTGNPPSNLFTQMRK